MRFAYADPPYVGQARKHYGPDAREVNHGLLIEYLERDFDGWALSCSTPSLRELLPLCPPSVRVLAWVKPFAIFKPGVNPAYAWEPVIFKSSGRKRLRTEPTVRDWAAVNVTLRRGLSGVKPDGFCYWLFEVANLQPDDHFEDVFPGSGAVGRAWEAWRAAVGGSGMTDDIEQAWIRNDGIDALARSIASVEPPAHERAAEVLRNLEECGFTLRLTTEEERGARRAALEVEMFGSARPPFDD